jgi:hypothetical protein
MVLESFTFQRPVVRGALIAGLLLLCGCAITKSRFGTYILSTGRPDVVIHFFNDWNGDAGISQAVIDGAPLDSDIARLAKVIEIRRDLLDVGRSRTYLTVLGPSFFGGVDALTLDARVTPAILGALRTDFYGLGPSDLLIGEERLAQLLSEASFSTLCTNLRRPPFENVCPAYAFLDRSTRQPIVVMGVISPRLRGLEVAQDVLASIRSAWALATEQRPDAAGAIVLSHAGSAADEAIAELEFVIAVLSGGRGAIRRPEVAEDPAIFQAGEGARYLQEVPFRRTRAGYIRDPDLVLASAALVGLSPDFDTNSSLDSISEDAASSLLESDLLNRVLDETRRTRVSFPEHVGCAIHSSVGTAADFALLERRAVVDEWPAEITYATLLRAVIQDSPIYLVSLSSSELEEITTRSNELLGTGRDLVLSDCGEGLRRVRADTDADTDADADAVGHTVAVTLETLAPLGDYGELIESAARAESLPSGTTIRAALLEWWKSSK